jgi:LysM repeat protein
MKKLFFITILLNSVILYSLEYTVVEGDCLWNIAKKYYNNPFLWVNIYQQNKDKIKNPNLIYPGQVFIIPELMTEEMSKTIISEQEKNEVVQEEQQVLLTTQTFTQHIEEKKTEESNKVVITEIKRTINIKDFKSLGKITSAKEKKFVYIDHDTVFCELEKFDVKIGDIFYIYHLGPSQYDVNLLNVPKDQLNLVGKMKVIKIDKDKIMCKILRAYSPIVIGDMITK